MPRFNELLRLLEWWSVMLSSFMQPILRIYLAAGCLSAWLLLLFTGFVFGGAVHLVLVVALVAMPWGAVLKRGAPVSHRDTSPPDS